MRPAPASGDYYLNTDNIIAFAGTGALPVAPVFAGTSARTDFGIAARFASGGQLTVGGERSGIGASFGLRGDDSAGEVSGDR